MLNVRHFQRRNVFLIKRRVSQQRHFALPYAMMCVLVGDYDKIFLTIVITYFLHIP